MPVGPGRLGARLVGRAISSTPGEDIRAIADLPASYVPGEGGTYSDDTVSCTVGFPRAVAVGFGFNPNSSSKPREGCTGGYTNGKPSGDEASYFCLIHEDPGSDASSNRASWLCQRYYDSTTPADERVAQRENNWMSKETRLFPERFSATLTGCLAPRAAVEDAVEPVARVRSRGLKVPVTCSTGCVVRLSAPRAKTRRRKLHPGKRTLLRIRLPRAASRVRLSIDVSAGGYRKRATASVRARGTRVTLKTPHTISLVKR